MSDKEIRSIYQTYAGYEEKAKTGVGQATVVMNKEKTKEVDLTKGEIFSFLGFEFSWRKSSFIGRI